jgi:hypothetical protein
MLLGMYVVWWVVGGGRRGARGRSSISIIITEPASAAGVKSGRGGPEKRKKAPLHGFDRALAICCVCMEEKCQPVSAHVALYVYVCV